MKMDNKVLIQFLKDIYLNVDPIILSTSDIKEIEKFYKDNYKKTDNFESFLALDPNIAKKIKKSNSVKTEVKRQFYSKKLLQSGTLCECVLAQTIADMYGLDCFADIFHSYIRDLPANIIYKLRDDNNKILCRYIYYSKENRNTFLIQYGNPTRYDADLYIDNQKIKLEFKDKIARAGEKETEYDEQGKLIYTEKFAAENPDYIPLIEKFNQETSMIDLNGNYKNLTEKSKRDMLKSYFGNLGFEVLISIDHKDCLLAVTKDCIDGDEETEIISLEGSEIRHSGKNPYTVFTPHLLEQSIEKIGGTITGEFVSIPANNMGKRIRNGKITGRKISKLFFVFERDVEPVQENYVFSINNVKQLKPTICAHMRIVATREFLIQYYQDVFTDEKL